MQMQPVVIDYVDVGLNPGGDYAAVGEPDRERGLPQLHRRA
jgi:hypothetical protein